jgi:hypothetical protein
MNIVRASLAEYLKHLSDARQELSFPHMKKLFALVTAAALCGMNHAAFAQTNAELASAFVNQAKAASDTKLGAIATQLTGNVWKLQSLLGTNSPIKTKLDGTLKSLTGGMDSAALTSAFDLVKGAKPTPEQLGLAKQVGNLTSAYVVQKNFATLEGAQGDVATIVSSLREGKVAAAIPAIKSVATNAKLTDMQKQLITTVADKYAPGWKKAGETLDAVKKLPGF